MSDKAEMTGIESEEAQAMQLRLLRLGGEWQADKPKRAPKCGQKCVSSHCLALGSGRNTQI